MNNELLTIWIARYLPEFGKISSPVRKLVEQRLRASLTDAARQETAHKISRHLATDCALAATDTQQLLSKAVTHSPDLWEVQELNVKIHQIYEALIEGYEKSFIFSPVVDYLHTIETETGRLAAAALVTPKFQHLMLTIGPLLRELKAIYFSSINRHLIGFMTTQIHLTRKRILSHLAPDDCNWFAPYLLLLDELMCMPWQRICSITSANPESIALVKKMMPQVSAISTRTYQQALRTYPSHVSCQGRIQSTDVQHSSLRDLNMLQAYIWLCILEDNTSVIEKQILPLCIQVFTLTNVQWELVTFAIQTIINIIQQQLTTNEHMLFQKYATAIEHLFLTANPESDALILLKQHNQPPDSLDHISFTWKPD